MKISLNRLNDFVRIPYTPNRLAEVLTMLGIEVEGMENQSARYDNFFIGKVITKEKHPDAKKLSVCTVTTGGEPRQIICGAPNVDAGQHVVVALPGAVVPSNGLVIGERAIRGVESSGMICSKAELGISGDHDGIWVLPEEAVVGQPLAEFLGENDVILDVALTANRADCLSHIGVARDIAAFAAVEMNVPSPVVTENGQPISATLSVEVIDSEKCPRYAARIVRGVTIQESPAWLKNHLTAIGLRPRNIAVDVTNFVMLECGQPLHAFDYDNLTDGKIIVRAAEDGEKFMTLDSKERLLDASMLMICDGVRPVAIAGVMGGENSEISDSTTTIAIESAYFQPSSIRRTSKKLGLSTDASYRFERGVDPNNNIIYALDRAASLIAELGGGTIDSGVIDIYPTPITANVITLRYRRVAEIIGIQIDAAKITSFLQRLGCSIIAETEDSVTVAAPSWRVDMEQEIDLVEEVARLYYYDDIAPSDVYTVPNVTQTAKEFGAPSMRRIIRDFLARRGFNQMYNYCFTDAASAGLFAEKAVEIVNPLGEEFAVMRTSLLPSALRVISRNIRMGADSLKLFETGKYYRVATSDIPSFVPGVTEHEAIVIVFSGNAETQHWSRKSRPADFYDAKGAAEELLDYLGLRFNTVPVEQPETGFTVNSVRIEIISEAGIINAGIVGEISAELRGQYDIAQPVYCVMLDAGKLYNIAAAAARYTKTSPFPGAERDAAFVLESSVTARRLLDTVGGSAGEFFRNATVFDVFSGGSLGDGKKSLGVRMEFSSHEKTLTEAEINAAVQSVVMAVAQELGGTLRG